jgi:hypothetical protein
MPVDAFKLRDKRYATASDSLKITAIIFPIIAVVIPKWLDMLAAEGKTKCVPRPPPPPSINQCGAPVWGRCASRSNFYFRAVRNVLAAAGAHRCPWPATV